MSIFHLVFRATSLVWHSESHLHFGVQSFHLSLVRHSEPSCLFCIWYSKPHLQFGVQSHRLFPIRHSKPSCHTFSSAFRVTSSVWHSEPHFQFGIQSHISSLVFKATAIFSVWAFKALIFSVWEFRATISSQFRHSEPPPSSQFWRSKPPSLLSFDVQSHHHFLITMFSVVLLSLTFRYVNSQLWHSQPSSSSVWHLKPPSFLSYSVQSHHIFSIRCSEPPYLLSYNIQSLNLL